MNPIYHRAKFLTSSPNLKNTPPDQGKEIAFAGRSNAGKSSAINTLASQSTLARTSKTPGRTQMLNFFGINDELRFVDLPGYGFATVPLEVKEKWHQLMREYFTHRKSLCAVVLVMDIRHPLKEFDCLMVDYCHFHEIPLHILLTKADKLSPGIGNRVLAQVREELCKFTLSMSVQLFSSLKKSGVDEAHQVLDKLFGLTQTATVPEAILSANP